MHSRLRSAGGRVAALDVGDVWTGVAVSDETRTLARPVSVVGSERLLEELESLVREEGVALLVVGVPKTLSGEVGYQARRVLDTLARIEERFPQLDVVRWDERFTTRLAAGSGPGGSSGKRGRRRGKNGGTGAGARGRVDHLAAARMLQEYLESGGTIETLQ